MAPNGLSLVMSLRLIPELPRVSPRIVDHQWVRLPRSGLYVRDAIFNERFINNSAVWPSPWGRDLTKEEAYIQKLDGSTGASLKLTVLNAEGRVWTMVAGGGASVVYR